jgi:hypothetical protein
MRDAPAPIHNDDNAARRRAVRRTVLLFAVVAALIYVGFILTGVLAR